MAVLHFDLNDISREPSDEQLQSLMEAGAEEARKQAAAAKARVLEVLRTNLQAQARNK